MMRSLFAGVSGIRNHQVQMDVIGNNIANVNTVGYKSGRVTFAEALSLTLQGATRPTESLGSINPTQIGLGMRIGSIDSIYNQGSLQNTNVKTDLAINGDGFFILSDGEQNFYSRAGSFRFDSDGRLVNHMDGKRVQGKMADANGVIQSGAVLQDIVLPFGQKVAAKGTTMVDLIGNLNAAESPTATITASPQLLAIEQSGDDSDVAGLFARGNSNSKILGLKQGLTTITVDDGTTTMTYNYVATDAGATSGDFHSLDDLIAEINADYAGSFSATLNADGSITMTDLSGAAHDLTFTSDNTALATSFSGANGSVDSSGGLTTTTDQFSHVANSAELVSNLRNSSGESLGLSTNDVITYGAQVGEGQMSGTFTVQAGSTLDDLTSSIATTLGLTATNGVSVSTDGKIVIEGDPGADNAVTAITIREPQNGIFNSAMTFSESQEAMDVDYTTSITVYDGLGDPHVLTVRFEKSPVSNQWTWNASLAGDELIASGSSGQLTFNADGSLNTFSYDNGVTAFEFDPANGSELVRLDFNLGELGGFDGITQFASSSTTVLNSQNGYSSGDLTDVHIGNTGEITGVFSNGVNKVLGQILLAKFVNNNGLVRQGNNHYQTSASSGIPSIVAAGENIGSEIIPGTLEMSNVNMAQEFTDMILAQRGFQANARIITTSDEMLTELVNIKR